MTASKVSLPRPKTLACLGLLALATWALPGPQPASAQTYTVLHGFAYPPRGLYGDLVQGTDGDFYGTTFQGGTGNVGTVFKVSAAGAITTLHSFTGSDGAFPDGGLVQATDGNFYGTTYMGGANDKGVVFKMTPPGVLTALHSFTGSDGAFPDGGLVQATDGNFYGTTTRGGVSNFGTVFKVTPGETLATIHSFAGSGDGDYPMGTLVQGSDGNLYGTTQGGTTSAGTVFKITLGGTLTPLHTFAGSDGAAPMAGLVQGSDGNFYGTASQGGTSNKGTVFKITPAGVLTSLRSFTGSNGASPFAGLVQGSDGNFYGTTFFGGTNDLGTIFQVTPSGTLTLLQSFAAGSGGHYPRTGLVQGSDGNFWGTTVDGGAGNLGTVFKISSAGALTTVASLSAGTDGFFPWANLVKGSDGDFYGTTQEGGPYNGGTVFKISSAGALTTLRPFTGATDGGRPSAGLVQGTDGDFYGTTTAGGSNGLGTVFKITPAGVLTTIRSFAGGSEGARPVASLVQASDLYLYGTTYEGGSSNLGTVFKISTAGALTTLYSFTGVSDGSGPYAGLIQGSDGNLYGTTSYWGPSGGGTVFRITPAGAMTVLHSFTALGDGGYPNAGLVDGNDGYFYGTTLYGGQFNGGTVFGITPAGVLTTLYSFNPAGTDGFNPAAFLVQGSDGSFYGTTDGGDAAGGTVFRITPAGTLTTLHVFPVRSDSYVPHYAGMAFGNDGNLYGTSWTSGPNGGGFVYSLTTAGATATVSGGGVICGSGSATIQADLTGTPPWDLTWSDGVTQSNVTTSPATRDVSPASTTVYTLTAFSDVTGPGSMSGSATVIVSAIPATPTIIAPASVSPGATGVAAAVIFNSGSTYLWGISNGTITAGDNTNQITFTAGTSGFVLLTVVETNADGCSSPTGNAAISIVGVVAPAGLAEDAHATGSTISNVNNILEPGETVLVNASWINVSASPLALTGTASAYAGPAGATYSLLDAAADYGTIAPGATADSYSAGGPSYRLSVSNPATRPATHWDATFLETLSTGDTKTWTLHIGQSFFDVPGGHIAYPYVENILHNGITTGCGGGNFCPNDSTPRWQMAILLARAMLGQGVAIPVAGTVGSSPYDCSASGTSLFGDVAPTDLGCPGIHYIYSKQVTVGCGGGNFCPNDLTPRWQTAVFLSRAMLGPGVPIPATGTVPAPYDCSAVGNSLFIDVVPTDVGCPGIHYIYSQAVTTGCAPGIYCPNDLTPRWQMAILLVRAFQLPFLQ